MRKTFLFSAFLLTLCIPVFANPDGEEGTNGDRNNPVIIPKRTPQNGPVSFFYEEGYLCLYSYAFTGEVSITLINLYSEEEVTFIESFVDGCIVLPIYLESGDYSIMIADTEASFERSFCIE
jgi:hypothetical protein